MVEGDPKENAKGKANDGTPDLDENTYYIIAYLLEIITGIAILLIVKEKDKRIKFHSFQAIFLGIGSIVVAIVFGLLYISVVATLVNILIWLYGMYAGLEAHNGHDIEIPLVSVYARRYSGYAPKHGPKPKK
jgi:uncharacterized membrane protein